MIEKMIKIFADGSCLGNPGCGGYAAVLIYGDVTKTVKGAENNTTNNRMELKAVIEGLKVIKNNKFIIEIYVDSVYVFKGITEYITIWKSNGRKLSTKEEVKNIELWQELDLIVKDLNIKWNWVKGHSDNHLNNLADKIARKEAKELKKLIV